MEMTGDLASQIGREDWSGVESDDVMKEEREVPGGVSQGGLGTHRRRNQHLVQASSSPIVTVTAESSIGHHFLGYVRVESQKSPARVEVSQLQAHEGREWAAHAPATGNVKVSNSVHSEAHVPDGLSNARGLQVCYPHTPQRNVGFEIRRSGNGKDEAGLWGRHHDDPKHLCDTGP